MTEAPAKLDALGKRVAELEEKIGQDWPPDVCKFCGKRAARLIHSTTANEKGIYRQNWACAECKNTEIRSLKAK